jgi:hypothetical protein
VTAHNLFYYPYASFTNEQLPLLKVAALYFVSFADAAKARDAWLSTAPLTGTRPPTGEPHNSAAGRESKES